VASADTPPVVLSTMSDAALEALAAPDVRRQLEALQLEP